MPCGIEPGWPRPMAVGGVPGAFGGRTQRSRNPAGIAQKVEQPAVGEPIHQVIELRDHRIEPPEGLEQLRAVGA